MPPKKRDDKGEDAGKDEVGVFFFSDGSKYDGQVNRREQAPARRHGSGLYYDIGTVYDGQWADDEMHGEGTIRFDTGATYTGTFYRGAFNGRGRYTWADGTSYEGLWRGNRMHGEGIYVDLAGRRWAGKFYDGVGAGLALETA